MNRGQPRSVSRVGARCAGCAGASVLAKQSGEALASGVGLPAEHAAMGRWVVLAAAALVLSVTALWWLDRHRAARTAPVSVLAGVSMLCAAAALTTVVMAGHSGAAAVWGPVVDHTTPGTFPVG